MHGSRTELRHAVAVVVAAAVVSLLGAGGTAPARGPASVDPSGPLGRSSGEWAARWWQWALAQPAAVNPLTDTTGELCARGRRGRMWFLAGTTGGDPVTRCTIPRGRWLLFPIVNNFSGATPGGPRRS